jgi:hypothetical protein
MTSINNQEKKGNGLLSGGKFGGTNTPANVASPVASNPEHLPTGYLPSQGQPAPSQPAPAKPAGAGLLNGQPTNNQPPPPKKGLLGGAQAYGATPAPAQRASTPPPGQPPYGPPGAPPPGQQSHGPGAPAQQYRPGAPAQQPGPRGPMNPPPGGPGSQGPQRPMGPGGPQSNMQAPPAPAAPAGPVGQIVLYRTQNFYVRTTIHPNKRSSSNPLRKPTGNTTMMPKIIPDQEERVAASETRMMPALDVPDNAPRKKFFIPPWFETVVVILGVIASVVAHAYNMFNYPLYEMDEGTYMSAAWAVTTGRIYPYAYGYGHPPFAWMQLAGLIQLAGGFFLFGNAINTGRVVMLLYTFGSTLLIYLIVRKMSDSRSAALLAMVVFAFSPLAIDFQRLVLLDNIATFWFLLSVYFLAISKSRLQFVALSAICFALAFLSKEILAVFLPAMIYGVWLQSTKFQRKFVLVAFSYAFIAIASLWLLLALLKGELFPTKFFPWDTHPHLSFFGTLLTQVGRGQKEGKFSDSLNDWFYSDSLLTGMGILAPAFNIVVGWWKRRQLFFGLLALSFWILLARGGVVFTFYFIPLIPLIAINVALMINTIAGWVGKFVRFDLLRAFLVFCALAGFAFFDWSHSGTDFHGNSTQVQTDTMAWIRANVPHDSYIVMNAYLYMELRVPGGAAVGNGSVYPNADVYVNIANDPALFTPVGGNWDKVDYIVADSEVYNYILDPKTLLPGARFLSDALVHSGPACAKFAANNYEIDIYCVKHQSPRPLALAPSSGSQNNADQPLLAGGTMPLDKRYLLG